MTTKQDETIATQSADVQHELFCALRNHTSQGVEMILSSIRVLHSDNHETNCSRLAEIIVADIQHRFVPNYGRSLDAFRC